MKVSYFQLDAEPKRSTREVKAFLAENRVTYGIDEAWRDPAGNEPDGTERYEAFRAAQKDEEKEKRDKERAKNGGYVDLDDVDYHELKNGHDLFNQPKRIEPPRGTKAWKERK